MAEMTKELQNWVELAQAEEDGSKEAQEIWDVVDQYKIIMSYSIGLRGPQQISEMSKAIMKIDKQIEFCESVM